MSMREEIMAAQTAAMKSGDKDALSTLRMLTSAIKNAEIDNGKELEDESVIALVKKQVKQLQDARKDFVTGERQDLVEKTDKELSLLEKYLPAQMSDEDLQKIVADTVSEVGANGPGDMGKVMGSVMGKVKGQADGNRVKEFVQKELTNQS